VNFPECDYDPIEKMWVCNNGKKENSEEALKCNANSDTVLAYCMSTTDNKNTFPPEIKCKKKDSDNLIRTRNR